MSVLDTIAKDSAKREHALEAERDAAIERMRVAYEELRFGFGDRHATIDALELLSAGLAELGAHPAHDDLPPGALSRPASYYDDYYNPVERRYAEDATAEEERWERLERRP